MRASDQRAVRIGRYAINESFARVLPIFIALCVYGSALEMKDCEFISPIPPGTGVSVDPMRDFNPGRQLQSDGI